MNIFFSSGRVQTCLLQESPTPLPQKSNSPLLNGLHPALGFARKETKGSLTVTCVSAPFYQTPKAAFEYPSKMTPTNQNSIVRVFFFFNCCMT